MTQASRDAAKFLKSTLRLPSATFPPRAPPADVARYLPRCTDDLYAWQRQKRPAEGTFRLHDGPPYANGDLHVGHALNKILKDIVCRSALAQGKRVDYTPGWDCHGLPIEIKALERHGWTRGQDADPVAVRKAARNFASNTVTKQMKGFKSWGIMADWANHWKTLDKDFEIRQLEIFQAMAGHGLIYRRHKPVFWSPSSGTALAEAELEYKDDHVSTSAYVKFPLHGLENQEPVFALIWTTTPWTLPANQAIAVHDNLQYILIKSQQQGLLVIAKSRLEAISQVIEDVRVVREVTAAELLKCTYEGLAEFKPFSADRPVVHADFVSAESGTGLVHCAPGHGMEDYLALGNLIKDGRVEVRAPVDGNGCFDSTASPSAPEVLNGLEVFKEGTPAVLALLERAGLLVSSAKYKHKYPIDWRTKEPVIIRATAQWFADVSSIREDALRALDDVRFVPESGKSRLRSFVANRSEWCISRQRAWGVPIPAIYHQSSSGEAVLTPQSVRHIIATIQQRGIDAWWSDPVDEPAWIEPSLGDSKQYRRGIDTMDVWFDSGTSWSSMTADTPQTSQLADVYLEGSDQHRGWFQSSLLTNIAFQKSMGKSSAFAPFRSLLTHGFTLDEQGKKMSKSLGNVISPDQIIEGLEPTVKTQQPTSKKQRERHSLGPDALRLWVASTDFTKDVTISETVVRTTHAALDKYRVTFKVLLGMLEDFDPAQSVAYEKMSTLDQIALLQLSTVVQSVHAACQEHEFHRAVSMINRWIAVDLSGFYFESVKDIIYCDSLKSERRLSASSTLYQIFKSMQDMLAPLLPLLVEETFEHSPAVIKGLEHPLKRVQSTLPAEWHDERLQQMLPTITAVNTAVKAAQELARAEKLLGQSLASEVTLYVNEDNSLKPESLPEETWQEILVVSKVKISRSKDFDTQTEQAVDHAKSSWIKSSVLTDVNGVKQATAVVAGPAEEKCARCWRYMAPPPQNEELPLCRRCEDVVQEYQQ